MLYALLRLRPRCSLALLLALALWPVFFGCASTRGTLAPPPSSPAPEEAPRLRDDRLEEGAPLSDLLDAIARHAEHLAQKRRPTPLRFGSREVPLPEYVSALRGLVEAGRAAPDAAAFLAEVARRFSLEEARFETPLLVTGYYEPIVAGARRRTARFSQPLYRLPPDWRRGQPYLTREEIDTGGALASRGLELCWVDPIDAFQIQTEGGGTVALDDGARLALDHAGTNARPAVSLGRALKGEIPKPVRGWADIERWLRSLPPDVMRRKLAANPRYAFFKPRAGDQGPATSIGLPAVDERTIATDAKLMPKGALGLLLTREPRFASDAGDAPAIPIGWDDVSRLVLDQDTGGAIQGARVDLYFGRGAIAGRAAGVMKEPGRLYYLAPK